jgi:L,D-peptidoglycan transpeptidase YkuD (ErfK/YbiS/YcfS/YnhG family)
VKIRHFVLWSLGIPVVALASAENEKPLADVTQLIVSIAADWDAPRGRLQLFERSDLGWEPVSAAIPVAYGRAGLAWGRGVLGTEEPGPRKVEGDLRAPAGVFALGRIFGNDPTAPAGVEFPYHQVTAADCWIEDPAHPDYNRHVVVDPADPPSWYERERMKQNDPAFRWRVEIRHNADPPVRGAGSAIFFHIRRGDRLTAGCTTMDEAALATMLRWLRTDAKPHYVLLPWAEYQRLAESWGLPPAEALRDLAP